MAQTVIPVGDAKAVKKYSAFLALDAPKKSYFSRKFMGVGETASMPIQQLNELENDAGEQISFDLTMQMTMQPVEGDDVLENKEQDLKFYTDSVKIDQLRGGINSGGRMTRKRTIHKLRKIARTRQSDWWARVFDELFFMYGSGARGVNAEYVFPTSYTGFAGNSITSPDADHILYAGNKTKATLTTSDKMTTVGIDKLKAKAVMMGGGSGGGSAGTDGNTQTPQIQPIKINGEDHFVWVGNPWQTFDMRTATTTGGWLDIQKAAAAAEGRKSNIFKGSLGMYNDVVLHEHKSVIRFTDYGSGGNVHAARALFMGEQAMVCAFGSPGTGLRFSWNEETRDNGNQLIITSNTIVGIKKVTFNGKDYGMMVFDTAAADPTA
ncbi:MAG: N4-gp56 family major capsid protein [Deltaproteobacteria bacterium]|nr:MAG: N4-gp56 family major capsid protein [Deltaproteobacteria bacterium]